MAAENIESIYDPTPPPRVMSQIALFVCVLRVIVHKFICFSATLRLVHPANHPGYLLFGCQNVILVTVKIGMNVPLSH